MISSILKQIPHDFDPIIKEFVVGFYFDETLFMCRRTGYRTCKGKLHGNIKKWYSNGRLSSDDNYKNGEKHGSCKIWCESGQLSENRYYDDGNLIDCFSTEFGN